MVEGTERIVRFKALGFAVFRLFRISKIIWELFVHIRVLLLSFIFNGRWRLLGNIVKHTIDAAHFSYNTAPDPLKQVLRHLLPIGAPALNLINPTKPNNI